MLSLRTRRRNASRDENRVPLRRRQSGINGREVYDTEGIPEREFSF